MMMNKLTGNFAGFIITHNRPYDLAKTIDAVLGQSLAPEKLIIIDNGNNPETANVVIQKMDIRLVYHHSKENLGPSGGARLALEMLSKEGFSFIFWGDDNDPPHFPDTFEILLSLFDAQGQSVGVVGQVGQYFNRSNGKIIRVPDLKIRSNKTLPVDVVSGGQSMIVSSSVIKQGILPRPEIFFGFEELDFCISLKKAGYNILVPTDLFLRCRELWGRVDYRLPLYKKKQLDALWREYYSTRNILYILKTNKFYLAFSLTLLRIMLKSLIGFRFGYKYGIRNFHFIFKGIVHNFSGIMGKQELL